jgi:hypothetical protein
MQLFVAAPGSQKNRPFYKRDVLNLCCYPEHDRLNLAFKKKWVEASVLSKISAAPLHFHNFPALVIFCEEIADEAIKKATHEVYNFHVVRKAKILKATDSGAAITFELELLQFVAPPLDSSDTHKRLLKQSVEHPNYERMPDNSPDPRAKFVRRTKDDLHLKVVADWNNVVERLSGLNGIADSLFLIPTDARAYQYPSFPLRASVSPLDDRTVASVRRGSETAFHLYAVPGTRIAFTPPTIEVSESVARVSGPYIRQYGNGYLLVYYLQVKSGWDSDNAMLRLATTAKDSSGNILYYSPEIAIHLRIVARIGLMTLVVAMLGLGTFLASMDKETLHSLLDVAVSNTLKQDEIVKHFLLAIKLFGSGLVALGAFVGFRKLPGPTGG